MNARSLASEIRRQHVTLASHTPAVRPAAMRLSALLAAQRLLPAHGGQRRAFYDTLTFASPMHRSAFRARAPISMLVTQAYATARGVLESVHPTRHVSGESMAHLEESTFHFDSPTGPDTHASVHVLARRLAPAAPADVHAPVAPASEQALDSVLPEENSAAPLDVHAATVRPITIAAATDAETHARVVLADDAGGHGIGPASPSGASVFASTPEPGRALVQLFAGLLRASAARRVMRARDPLALITRSHARGGGLLSASAQAGQTWESPLLQQHPMVLGRTGISAVLGRQAALPGALTVAGRDAHQSAAASAVGKHPSANTQTHQESGTAPVAPDALTVLTIEQRGASGPSELPILRARQTPAVTRDGGTVQAVATPYAHGVQAERWRAEPSLPTPIPSPAGEHIAASTAPLRVTGSTALPRVAAIPMRAAWLITPEHLSPQIVPDGVFPVASGVLSRPRAVSRPSSLVVVAPMREPDASAGAFPHASAITYNASGGATDHAEVALSHAPLADIAPTLADAAGQVPLVRAAPAALPVADGSEDFLSTTPPLEHRYVRRYIQRATDAEPAYDDASDLVARETTRAADTARSDGQSEREPPADLPLHSAATTAERGVSPPEGVRVSAGGSAGVPYPRTFSHTTPARVARRQGGGGRERGADARAVPSLTLSSAASNLIARRLARDLRLTIDMRGALPSNALATISAQRAGATAMGSRADAGFGSFQHHPIASPMIWRRLAATDQPIIVSASPLQDRMDPRAQDAGTTQVHEHADRTDLHEGFAVVGEAQQPGDAMRTAPLLAATGLSLRRSPAAPFKFMNVLPRFAGAAAEHAARWGHADVGPELFPFTPVYRAEAAQAPTAASAGSTAAVPAVSAPAGAPPAGPGAVDLDELAERTLRKLVRMLAIEKERRGAL